MRVPYENRFHELEPLLARVESLRATSTMSGERCTSPRLSTAAC